MTEPNKLDGASRHEAVLGVVKRVTAVLLVFATLILFAGAVLLPLHGWYSQYEQRLEQALATKARLKAVADYGVADGSRTDGAAISTYAGDFLAGAEDALIMANLQTRLRALVVSRNCEFSSARTLSPKSVDGLTYLGVKIQLKGDLRDVQHIVHGIETAAPFLFIERAHLRLDERRALAGGASTDVVPRLQAELDVYGARGPGPPPVALPGKSR